MSEFNSAQEAFCSAFAYRDCGNPFVFLITFNHRPSAVRLSLPRVRQTLVYADAAKTALLRSVTGVNAGPLVWLKGIQ